MGISIVICSYNDSHFLPKALNSCLEQQIDKEIIVVDDCSTVPVNSSAIELIRAHGIKVIRHSRNQGLGTARNTGITIAKETWIIPLDADDWFYPGALKALLQSSGGVDIVCGNCTDSGTWIPGIASGLSKEKFVQDNQLICSSLFSKSVWEGVGGYMTHPTPSYEDWNFWAKAYAKNYKFKYINFTVYHHTSRPDSMLRVLHPNAAFYRKLATEGVF
jgi:glycosyltransferase involved in cell wall biosynthesis